MILYPLAFHTMGIVAVQAMDFKVHIQRHMAYRVVFDSQFPAITHGKIPRVWGTVTAFFVTLKETNIS